MNYNGKWLPADPPSDLFKLTRQEVTVLNILAKKERNEYEIWTICQSEKPPYTWEEVRNTLLSLEKANLIRRLKE